MLIPRHAPIFGPLGEHQSHADVNTITGQESGLAEMEKHSWDSRPDSVCQRRRHDERKVGFPGFPMYLLVLEGQSLLAGVSVKHRRSGHSEERLIDRELM